MNTGHVGLELESFPSWVPTSARHYLFHTEVGLSIRAVAREAGCHASTVMRQIRKLENRRDDPLVDEALVSLGSHHLHVPDDCNLRGHRTMNAAVDPKTLDFSHAVLKSQAQHVLRLLCDPSAVLAVADTMEKAVVVRDGVGDKDATTEIVDRAVAQAMALKEWIAVVSNGRIARYKITALGRTELKSMLAEAENKASGFAEAQTGFDGAPLSDGQTANSARRIRYASSESPITSLARRKDRNGKPFLSEELVTAGERLREDFEIAQMGPRTTQNWDKFLTSGVHEDKHWTSTNDAGPSAAKDRVMFALKELGPGLADVVLRCCCYQEGLEQAEKKMGWSARSGKVVLRIALQRLRRHYEDQHGPYGPMIG